MQYRPASFLQNLLQDRFNLHVRHETRTLPIYKLVWVRSDHRRGPNLKPSSANCTPPPGEPSPCRMGGYANGYSAVGQRWGGGFFNMLRSETQRQVVDETGLSGDFDIKVEWTRGLTAATGPSDIEYVSLFAALEEQLGLKLVAAQGPVDVFVIEHIDRPTPN